MLSVSLDKLLISQNVIQFSETDDVVHNVFLNRQYHSITLDRLPSVDNTWGIVTSFISHCMKYVSKWNQQILFDAFRMISTQDLAQGL